jgi:ferredoxin-NADP reductase
VIDLRETGDTRAATLVYWGRDPGRMPYHAELAALARRDPDFAYHPVVESDASAAETVSRIVTDAGPIAYVSGGGQMINEVRDVLMARGLDRKSVRWEKFW